MSESLPYSGVEIVEVIRYAVVTQACRERPLRSSPIVWSRAARNMPIIRPSRIVRICRWLMVKEAGASAEASAGAAEVAAEVSAEVAGAVLVGASLTGTRYAAKPTGTVRNP